MANPSVTYTFTNGTTADGSQVSQNFADLIAGMTDGTKSFSIDALTVGGAALFNGAVTLGNASGDDITVTGSLASSIPVKTDSTFDIGDSTHAIRVGYFDKIQGGSTAGCEIVGRTDGNAPGAGMIGEKVDFTSRSISAVTTGYVGSSALCTLGAGTWELYARVSCSTPGGITGIAGVLASNTSDDASGFLTLSTGAATSAINYNAAIPSYCATISTSTSYYGKATSTGANATVTITGYAIRRA